MTNIADARDIGSSGIMKGKLYHARELNVVSAVISISGIIFQLLLASNMSYLLGNAIVQYSVTIGLFLCGMGVGSYLSRYIGDKHLYTRFIAVQLIIALVGGSSVFLLFTAYAYTDFYRPLAYLLILLIGTNVGCELPILVRMVTEIMHSLKDGAANILAWDYIGSLIGSLLVPFLIIPFFGYVRGAFTIGFLNLCVAVFIFWRYYHKITNKTILGFITVAIALILLGGIVTGDALSFSMEQKLYKDYIIKSFDTQYQKVTLTKNDKDLRLYLNGNLQFSSLDEYRYHEPLVHIPAAVTPRRNHVLVLGGGDGMAVRELLKYEDVKDITLVDLDKALVEFCREEPLIARINNKSLESPKVKIINQDAYKYLENNQTLYNIIIVDLPDPNNESLNKLYTLEFYTLIKDHLAPGGTVSIQSTSPVFAPKVFWTIVNTVEAVGLEVFPYHADVPSFGNWGFTLAANYDIKPGKIDIQTDTKYLNNQIIPGMFTFARDEKVDTDAVNTLLKPVILPMYMDAWQNY
ncbi:MAG: polyamine aminopropyltransferase [Firmicutes bacterium]|nr:polyamine aminopropyltransferase [Bacillota bacterium]